MSGWSRITRWLLATALRLNNDPLGGLDGFCLRWLLSLHARLAVNDRTPRFVMIASW
jgi:hypothetical protein